MADNLMMNVPQNFNGDAFIEQLASSFRAEGFNVNVINLYGAKKMQIKKNCSGLKNFMGLGQGITVNFSMNNDVLTLAFSDGNWTFKFVALAIGILLGLFLIKFFFLIGLIIGIPFLICSIIGIVKQSSLANKISDQATMLISQMSGPQQNSPVNF